MRFDWLTSRQRFLLRPWMEVIATIVFFASAGLPFVFFSVEVAGPVAIALEAITFPLSLKVLVEV